MCNHIKSLQPFYFLVDLPAYKERNGAGSLFDGFAVIDLETVVKQVKADKIFVVAGEGTES